MIILVSLSLILCSQAIIPSHNKATASLAFMRRSINQQKQYDLGLHRMKSIRGGNFDSNSEYDKSDCGYDEEESEVDVVSEVDEVDVESEVDEESEVDVESEEDEESESEIEEEEEENAFIEEEDEGEPDVDEEEEEESEENENAASTSSLPVKVTLKTSLSNNILIDQSIELTASPTRTVESLKQSVSRQFKSRPPMDAIILRLDGQLLHDDTLVQDLVDEEDEDDEEDDDDEDDDLAKLTIIVDMVPPVDPKFGTEMRERLDVMTNEEVLDAYIANLASMHQNSVDLMKPRTTAKDDDDEEDEEGKESSSTEPVPQANLAMQQYSLMLKDQIMESLSEREQELLKKTDTPSSPQEDDLESYGGDMLLKESMKRKKRRGGATANVKRALQKNLNIVSEAVWKTSLWCE